MNKRATNAQPKVNYPDVLGAITGGKRLGIDAVQVAVATRPATVAAGFPIEAVVLLQNTLNIDVDAVIRLTMPEKDAAGHKGRFNTTMLKPVRIGLRPGEMGYATFPATVGPEVTPSKDYALIIEIGVEQKKRGASVVRDANGGAPFNLQELSEAQQALVPPLDGLNFSIQTTGKVLPATAKVLAPFEVTPATVRALSKEVKPSYITLWNADNFLDEGALVQKVKPFTDKLLPQMNRNGVFFPLLKATQAHFESADYRLWAGEAVAIAKILTLVIESGIANIKAGTYPRWFMKLTRLITDNPRAVAGVEPLVAETLYIDLAAEAAALSFSMLADVLHEDVGSADEIASFIEDLSRSLSGQGDPITMTRAYMPLILAGITANTQITMPQEQVQETASLIAYALEQREAEKNEDNQFIFDLANDLVQRALEHF